MMALRTIQRWTSLRWPRIRAATPPLFGGSSHRCCSSCSSVVTTRRPLAVVLGVANHRSIAWACVQEFLLQGYDCVFTYQQAQHASKMEQLILTQQQQQQQQSTNKIHHGPRILGCLPCNVEHPNELATTIGERLPELLRQQQQQQSAAMDDLNVSSEDDRRVDAVVHSIAYCRDLDQPLLQISLQAYLQAQHISAYSFLETARCFQQNQLLHDSTPTTHSSSSSLTALSYLGSTRAVPGYGAMGPAKAALESLVRGMAVELGENNNVRCNAVSAGPIRTAALRGVPHATELFQHVAATAPLRRNVRVEEVARTVVWLASPAASGITGQTIYVDAGYSAVVPVNV